MQVIVVYGSGEIDSAAEKNEFWEKLQVYEDSKDIIIMGDFNARIGNKTEGVQCVMEKFEEAVIIKNGKILIAKWVSNTEFNLPI